jgi:sugar O-acyltransferase (sialic acid O-acetyltransferase NeuD family)
VKDIIILGAGGVGREVALLIQQINRDKPRWNLLGFLDDNRELHNKDINGFKVLGDLHYMDNLRDMYVVLAVANYKVKKRLAEEAANRKLRFANIIHPSVDVSGTNSMGEGLVIYPGVVMTTNIYIGNHVIISPKCGIGHQSVIENYCSLLWNVNISGNVLLKEGCLIGSGATVIQNITVGRETIVGAGSVVVRDLPDRCTAVGIPCRPVKFH